MTTSTADVEAWAVYDDDTDDYSFCHIYPSGNGHGDGEFYGYGAANGDGSGDARREWFFDPPSPQLIERMNRLLKATRSQGRSRG